MKRNLLALAVGVAFVLPLAAQAAPTVYGRLNLSVDYVDADTVAANTDGQVWQLNSNASRIGVKGNEKLTDELTAVYKAEWDVKGDVGGADLAGRERYIGLKHYQWGTVRLGNIDSPFKNSEDSIDVFNDMANLDMGNFLYGQNRLGNSINYVSPKFLDVFGANVTLQPGEAVKNENHIADAISLALSYEDDSLYLSAAMDKEVMNAATAIDSDAMRFLARYKINESITASAMFQTAEPTLNPTDAKEESIAVSASYVMGSVTARGEVLLVNASSNAGDNDTMLVGGGVDYNFTQSSKAFANLALKNQEVTGGTSLDTIYLGFGMETRF